MNRLFLFLILIFPQLCIEFLIYKHTEAIEHSNKIPKILVKVLKSSRENVSILFWLYCLEVAEE